MNFAVTFFPAGRIRVLAQNAAKERDEAADGSSSPEMDLSGSQHGGLVLASEGDDEESQDSDHRTSSPQRSQASSSGGSISSSALSSFHRSSSSALDVLPPSSSSSSQVDFFYVILFRILIFGTDCVQRLQPASESEEEPLSQQAARAPGIFFGNFNTET